jgi:hypothetical protein
MPPCTGGGEHAPQTRQPVCKACEALKHLPHSSISATLRSGRVGKLAEVVSLPAQMVVQTWQRSLPAPPPPAQPPRHRSPGQQGPSPAGDIATSQQMGDMKGTRAQRTTEATPTALPQMGSRGNYRSNRNQISNAKEKPLLRCRWSNFPPHLAAIQDAGGGHLRQLARAAAACVASATSQHSVRKPDTGM